MPLLKISLDVLIMLYVLFSSKSSSGRKFTSKLSNVVGKIQFLTGFNFLMACWQENSLTTVGRIQILNICWPENFFFSFPCVLCIGQLTMWQMASLRTNECESKREQAAECRPWSFLQHNLRNNILVSFAAFCSKSVKPSPHSRDTKV